MRQIIYAWNYREWGGVQIYFLSLIKVVRRQYRVTVVLPENSDSRMIRALDELGVKSVFTPPAPVVERPKGIFSGLTYRFEVMASENRMVSSIIRIAGNKETLIHVDLGFWQSILPLFRLSRKFPVFVTQHTGMTRPNALRDAIWKIKGRLAASFGRLRYLASNADAKARLSVYLGEARNRETIVTYSGFDPDEIDAVTASYPGDKTLRAKYSLPDGPLVVTVGQFIERKGCWVVARALKALNKQGTDFTFLWLTTTPIGPETQRRIDEYGLGERLRLISSDDMGGARSEMLSLVLAADIFVLASLQEGLPIALVEAMALGRACIATSVNAIPEAVENDISGVLIGPNDEAGLTREIQRLLSDEKLREKLGSSARAVALKRFNEKVTAETTLKLYDAVWKSGQ